MAGCNTLPLLLLLASALAKDCAIDNSSQELSWGKELYMDLFDGFHPENPPPTNGSEPIAVRIKFRVKNFRFDSREEVFTLFTMMFISWKDERLKWDPTNYGGLKTVEFTSIDIWMPTFRLFNCANSYDNYRFFYSECILNYMGSVNCLPKATHDTICNVNLHNWPYDRQKCSVIYGAISGAGRCINITSIGRKATIIDTKYGTDWTIVDYEEIQDQNSEKQLQMVFTVEREAVTLAALIIYPSYVLIALNLATLFLDVRSNARFHLVCFNLFCHYYFISELGQNIPKESIESPTIIFYYRGSEVLVIINLLATISLRALCAKRYQAGNLLVATNNAIYKGFARFLVYPRWDPENIGLIARGLDDDGKSIDDWAKFANAVNSVCIMIFISVYVGLYCGYMPQPHPIIN